MSLRKLWLAWNNFWFAEGSPIPVALFRIAIGCLVLVFYWWISPEATSFFGRHAIVHPSTVAHWMRYPELDILSYFPNDDAWLQRMLLVLLVAGFGLIFGLFSRTSALVVFLTMLSLDSRNHFVLNTGVKIMIVMTFFLIFSRCGEALSLDRLLKIWRPRNPEFGPAKPGSIFAQRMMQVQMALVYWSAATCKMHGAAWINGTAVFYSVHLVQFQRFSAPYLFDHLWTCQLLSWGTVLFEFSFPFLIWIKEFRYPLLIMGVLFHAGLDWAMVIPLFQLVMLASYIPFVDATDLSKVMLLVKHLVHKIIPRQFVFTFDDASDFSRRKAETIRRLDVFGLVELKKL